MDCEEVRAMLEAMDGRERVRLLNMGAANALYGCLVQGGANRVGQAAHDLGVSVKSVYAWCANTATAPTAALRYCVETWADEGCRTELAPKRKAAAK